MNLKEHYVKTTVFLTLLGEESEFGKAIRVLLMRFSKNECVQFVLNSTRLKRRQKFTHLRNRKDVIGQAIAKRDIEQRAFF